MANISSWIADVSTRIPGAGKTEIESAIRAVIREFCSKTLLYLRQLTAINIVDGTATYTLTAPTDTAIVSVERVEISGAPINPTSMDYLDRSMDDWRSLESTSPAEYMVDVERVLRFKETPTENITGGLVVWVSLKPSPTTDTIPDFIYDDWYETILNGVISYLMKIPGKSWTNLQGAEYFDDYYHSTLGDAKSQKFTGKTKLSLRVQSPPFNVIG